MRPTGLILGDTFAAEIRHRATGDTRFLLPGRARVKRTRCRSALAGVEGLEPLTPGFGDRCSDQLSYTPLAARLYIGPPRPALLPPTEGTARRRPCEPRSSAPFAGPH